MSVARVLGAGNHGRDEQLDHLVEAQPIVLERDIVESGGEADDGAQGEQAQR